jgi:hypothetical protein
MKKKKIKTLEALAKSKLTVLHPSKVQKGNFQPSFLQFEGYTDLFLSIESLIKVSIMASHTIDSSVREDPGLDIRKTLEIVHQLLPFEEGEFLDEAYAILKQKPSNS